MTVRDVTPPTVVFNTISVQLNAGGNYTLTQADVNNISAGTRDSCGTASTNISPNTFIYCNAGSPSVTLTVTDVNGNSAQATGTITVSAPIGAPAVVYVDTNYTGVCTNVTFPFNGGTGTYYIGYNAFSTIQAGINAVAGNGTVNVAPETHPVDQIYINKGLTLQGAGASSTIIDGGNAVNASQGTIYLYHTSATVTIDGFTFINPGYDTSAEETAAIEGSHPSAPVTISHCHFIGVADNGADPFDNAIWVYHPNAGGVINITNNEFDHQWQSILLEMQGDGAVVAGNNFHDLFAQSDGVTTYPPEAVYLWADGGVNITAPVTINNNTFSAFDGWSIVLRGGEGDGGPARFINDVTIENNQINADGAGIVLRNQAATPSNAALDGIVGSTISWNAISSITPGSGAGIWLRGPNDNTTITNNAISGYANDILSEEYNVGAGVSAGVVAQWNSLTGSLTGNYGVSNQGPSTINAASNWWGGVSGSFNAVLNPYGPTAYCGGMFPSRFYALRG